MIERRTVYTQIETALRRSRVVALIGPRQSGKTTMARQFVTPESLNYFDLEDPVSLARLDEPMTALRDLRGLVVIDEVQRRPDLFPVLRVLVDRQPSPARFLILGSAAFSAPASRVTGRTAGDDHAEWPQPGGSRERSAGAPLVARRLSPGVFGRKRG
jgi:predicted AAA+ superfamily ATPase